MVTFTQSLANEAGNDEGSLPVEPVTQLELASLKLLRENLDQLDSESRQLRYSILRKLKAGAAVERGQFGVHVRESLVRKFSRKGIERAFGPQYVSEIAARLPESKSTALYITEPRCEQVESKSNAEGDSCRLDTECQTELPDEH